MGKDPTDHFKQTERLAVALKRRSVYEWIVTKGYYPESYVLPPCFQVVKHPHFGKVYFPNLKKKFKFAQYLEVPFPKTELIDRTFRIIDPELHSDIAYIIARNWKTILKCLFDQKNKVCSYSFPIPLSAENPGEIGKLRSGRMIYEYIEMAENDIASIAYNYKCLIKTDIANFYPSVYTHSIPWAIHGKKTIRKKRNRTDFRFFGNRLDKLIQCANDDCTVGIPIGPVVSDLISEIILAKVDKQLSKHINEKFFVARFKDDYRILAKSESDGKHLLKIFQSILKEYKLELNISKTEFFKLPDGLFRNWVSQYHSVNPRPRAMYSYKRFKEVYLSVITIDRQNPGTGVIDRFLADIATSKDGLRVFINKRTLPKLISLLIMLADLRTKAFPKVLAIIDSVLITPLGKEHSDDIAKYLVDLLGTLSENESGNEYLISWIWYFLRANRFEKKITFKTKYRDEVVRSSYSSRSAIFKKCKDFILFRGIRSTAKDINLLSHLDVFKPQ